MNSSKMRTKVPILLMVLVVTLCQAECPIECYCDQVTICSGDKHLTHLPSSSSAPLIPRPEEEEEEENKNNKNKGESWSSSHVLRLELHDFLLEHLDKAQLLHVLRSASPNSSSITELRLTNNKHLSSMDNDTFTETKSPGVVVVVVSGNKSGNNNSTSSGSGASNNNNNNESSAESLSLRTLDLSGNALKYFVGGGRLSKVRVLDLSSNGLQQVYQLQALSSLESINLRDNQLTYLQETLFQNLGNLQYINLDSNKIGHVEPGTFSNLPSLAHLILSSNPIENLLPGFLWNSRVQFVDVSRVGLTRIPTSLTTSVRDFRCANNNLTTVRQSDFESYPNVGLLVLDENYIQLVEDDAFGRLEFLARLWINGNRLTRIPQNLPPSLRSLQLEDNRIASINNSDFKNLKALEELNLHGNGIVSVPSDVFSELINLKRLDLRSNKIDTLYKNSFHNLSLLETLDVSQNPIKVIVNGVFNDFKRLNLLHLSRLQEKGLEIDTNSLHPLVNLQVLELDDSPYLSNIIFRDGAFSFFTSLIELNLQRCQLSDLQLVSTALVESPIFDSLHVLKLSGNPWDCSGVLEEDQQLTQFLQLYKQKAIVDIDLMICGDPKGVKVLSVALNSSSNDNTRSDFTSPASTSTTATPIKRTTSPTSSAFNTNPVANKSLLSTTHVSASPSVNITTSLKPSSTTTQPSLQGKVVRGESTRTTTRAKASRPAAAAALTTPAAGSSQLGITITEKPTRSYFETEPTTFTYTTSESTAPDGPSQEEDEKKNRKKLLITHHEHSHQPAGRGEDMDGESRKLSPQPEKKNQGEKTNDDNAIIDEERSNRRSNPMSSQQDSKLELPITAQRTRKHQKQSQQQQHSPPTTVRRGSIDGFPALHPPHHQEDQIDHDDNKDEDHEDDPVTHQAHTSPHIKSLAIQHPNPSYLKSYPKRGQADDNEDETTAPSSKEDDSSSGTQSVGKKGTVIIKTLMILAVACLLSILFLLSLSLIVFRFSSSYSASVSSASSAAALATSWRLKTRAFPRALGRRKWDKTRGDEQEGGEGEEQVSVSSFSNNGPCSPYQNLNLPSTPHHHHQQQQQQQQQQQYPLQQHHHHHYPHHHHQLRGPTGMSYTRLGDQDTVELSGITNRLYFENEDIYHIT